MSDKCLRIKVSGKVQEVWFRASTKRKADEIGLSGVVKNEKDGTVYITVTGSENALESFVSWCSEGPELARVKEVLVEEIEWIAFSGFEVIR